MDFRLLKAKAWKHLQIIQHPAKAGCKKGWFKKAESKKKRLKQLKQGAINELKKKDVKKLRNIILISIQFW